MILRFAIALAMLFLVTPTLAQFSTTTKTVQHVDCDDLTLQAAAKSSDGKEWSYTLAGVCRLISDVYRDGDFSGSKEAGRAFATIGGKWTQKENEALESVKFEGEMVGKLSSKFKCSQNPFVAKIGCVVEAVSNDTPWDKLATVIMESNAPLASGRVNAAQAEQIASTSGSPPPPPPPPPPPAPTLFMTTPAFLLSPLAAVGGRVTLEGEALVEGASGQGEAVAQDMTSFGTTWSNNGQLFWRPDAVGSLLSIPIDAPQGGYSIVVHLTRAPDYGQVRAYVRYETGGAPGDTVFVDFDGYANSVQGPNAIDLAVPGTTGPMTLVLITMGKNAASLGLLAGIDRVEISRTQ